MRTLALLALGVAMPASAGGLLLGVTSAGLLPAAMPAAASVDSTECLACDKVPPTRPVMEPMPAITFPMRAELMGEPAWFEPADLAAFEALRSSQCPEGPEHCLAWQPSGLRFSLAAP